MSSNPLQIIPIPKQLWISDGTPSIWAQIRNPRRFGSVQNLRYPKLCLHGERTPDRNSYNARSARRAISINNEVETDVPGSIIEVRDEHEKYAQSWKEELNRLDGFKSLSKKKSVMGILIRGL